MTTVRFRQFARRDLRELISYYESQQAGLGTRFVTVLSSHVSLLAPFPEMYAETKRGFRCISMKQFPILVHYRVEPNEIVVVALIHGARDQDEALKGR